MNRRDKMCKTRELRRGYIVYNNRVIGSILTRDTCGMKRFATDYVERRGAFHSYIEPFSATLSFAKRREKEYCQLKKHPRYYHFNDKTGGLEW